MQAPCTQTIPFLKGIVSSSGVSSSGCSFSSPLGGCPFGFAGASAPAVPGSLPSAFPLYSGRDRMSTVDAIVGMTPHPELFEQNGPFPGSRAIPPEWMEERMDG